MTLDQWLESVLADADPDENGGYGPAVEPKRW